MNSKYLTAGLFVVAAVILAVVLVYPKYQAFRSAARAAADKQAELDAETALINEINKTKNRYEKAEEDLLKVADLLPVFGPKSVPNLFVEMENIASENGILINSISFSASSDQANKKDGGKGHKTVNVVISAFGSYEAFKRFADAVEKNQHLMDITSVSIAVKKSEGEKTGTSTADNLTAPDVYNYSINLNAYYQ